MTPLARVRLPLLVLAVVVAQHSLLDGWRVGGAHPDALLVLVLALGLSTGPREGAAAGFALGLVADLFVDTQFGLSALAYGLAGLGAGLFAGTAVRSSWWLAAVLAAFASAWATLVFAAAGDLVGEGGLLHHDLAVVATVVSAGSAVLVGPALRAARWALAERQGHPAGGLR
ncbi:MAG TPA: rod shape-determining protein MreD [Acidimicrobiales bacterium]|nr:rod shape-determining protein MreD [Acidimicrobiales bacterium]